MNIFTCFFSGVRFHKTSKLQLIHNHFCSHSFSLLHLVETKKWCTLELKYLSCIRCLFWECTDQMSVWWLAAHREDRLKTRFHQVPWTFLNILEFQKVYSRLWKSWNFIYVLSKLWNIRVCFVHFKDWVSFTVGLGNSGNLTFGLQRKNIFLVLLARSQSGQIHQWFTEISDISIMRFQPGSIITGKEHVSWIKFIYPQREILSLRLRCFFYNCLKDFKVKIFGIWVHIEVVDNIYFWMQTWQFWARDIVDISSNTLLTLWHLCDFWLILSEAISEMQMRL